MEGKYIAICLDDEKIILKGLLSMVNGHPLIKQAEGFTKPSEAVEWVKNNAVDIAFLDIEMFNKSGIEIAVEMKKYRPNLWVIFVTGYQQYALEAFSIHANGFLTKPADENDINREILYYHSKMASLKPEEPDIKIQTFGNFDVFIRGVRVHFSYHLSKEVLAYLINKRGSTATISELATNLCCEYTQNEISAKSMVRTAISKLQKLSEKYNFPDIIQKERNAISVKTELVDCDYYKFLDGDENTKKLYTGEYMSNYSWAEATNAWLFAHSKNKPESSLET